MPEIIDLYRGENEFLSNFPDCKVYLDGVAYQSVEHAYQAAKTLDPARRVPFTYPGLSAMQSKFMGRNLKIRPDWDLKYRDEVMWDLLCQKFFRNEFGDLSFSHKLQATGLATLIEGNWWHDTHFGICYGDFKGRACKRGLHTPVGNNMLGRMQMTIRDCSRDQLLIDRLSKPFDASLNLY